MSAAGMELNIKEGFAAFFSNPDITGNIVKTVVLILVLLMLKTIVTRNVDSWKGLPLEGRRRWIVSIRNITVFLIFIGFVLIWGSQIKEFALSVAAVTIGVVMCFKELIANFMGGMSRTISHEYSVGDRISIGTHRGDVIDIDTLTTTILEIGPGLSSHQYTGSTITIPNSLLLTTPVVNESFMQEYLLHVFHVPVGTKDDWRLTERLLLQAAYFVCEPYLMNARKYMENMARKISVDTPSADPRVSIIFKSPDEIDLVMRVPVPSRRKGRIEQEIIRKYLDLLDAAGV